ncbi:MAG: indolepyruvate ferredoxin oxidoreductase family protein [Burkholderiaceae bacterium]
MGRLQGDLRNRRVGRIGRAVGTARVPTHALDAAGRRPALPLARSARPADRRAHGGEEGRGSGFRRGQPDRPRDLRYSRCAIRDRHHRQGPPGPDGGASTTRAGRGRLPPPGHRCLQGRHGLAIGPARRAGLRTRQARDPGRGGKARHRREPVQGVFLRLSGRQARPHGRQDRREWRPAGALDRELSPHRLLPIVAARLDQHFAERRLPRRAEEILAHGAAPIEVTGATRTPYFCSGCPHNRSTRVPDGSQALAGIGCHFMASWMDRNTTSLIQMGGEGVNWAASSRFTGHGHVFQNLGEGTWYHSGSMAIRQAIAAGANITYKVLFNDAVAMTGGQPVDGPVSPQSIAQAARAEGVARIAIVSDEPQAFSAPAFPPGVTIHHRDELDPLQRELRTVPGVSMLIYVQACATEKRRRRKRGQIEDPARQPFINTLVCEGCGDCSTRSNCLSVEPVDTPFGRKRRINMSSCNKDFSCVDGFCPSFVTVHGHPRRRPSGGLDPMKRTAALPMPTQTSLDAPYDLLVTGVGGTGVITVGALISMAAHLDGLGVSVLDFTGFAQKFGPVLSFLRLAANPSDLNQVRIEHGSADALIGCDVVVSSSPKASLLYRPGMRAVVNLAQMPTGDVVRHRDATLSVDARVAAIRAAIGDEGLSTLDANRAAEALLGNTVFANVMMLGHAWQRGLVPVSLAALLRAIELNGAAPDANRRAFAWGRLSAADPDFVAQAIGDTRPRPETLDELIARHAGFLRDYQNDAFARHYVDWLAWVREAEQPLGSEAMSRAVATTLFRLMAVKDEYEVARLYLDPSFRRELDARFEAGYRLTYHFAAPWLSRRRDAEGHPRKLAFGEWVRWPLRILASLRRLRASALDPFARGGERREAAELLDWYERTLVELLPRLNADTLDDAVRIAAAPQSVRGFGHVRSARVGPLMAEVEGLLAKLSPAAPRATPMKRERDPVDATPANAR